MSDLTRIHVHPFEFILHNFSEDFYADNNLPTNSWHAGTEVRLRPVAIDVSATDDIHDLLLTDFDLNGVPDLVVLDGERLCVLGRSKVKGPWNMACAGWMITSGSTSMEGGGAW